MYSAYQNATVSRYVASQSITIGSSGSNTIIVYYKVPLTITAKDKSKPYDGIPLTESGFDVTGLVNGDAASKFSASMTAASTITNFGTQPNVIDPATVKYDNGAVPGYYTVRYVPGTLTITKAATGLTVTATPYNKPYDGSAHTISASGKLTITPITTEIIIKAESGSKTYDGKALTNPGYTYTENVLLNGDVLSAVTEGSQINAGQSANVIKSYKVMQGDTDVTANYTFGKSIDGTLVVTKRSVTLTSASASKTYDGKALTNFTVTESGDGFVENEGAAYTVTGSQKDVGSSPNTFTYTLNQGTSADNYNITKVEGTLTVTRRPSLPISITYTLSYESNGGTKYSDETYDANKVVQLDKQPIRTGYTFTGWYADTALTQLITSIKMTSDKTVYASWEKTETPPILNDEDHFAYIIGRSDGLVHPDANITRAEVATIFFRLLKDEVRDENLTKTNAFSDVSSDAWYNTAVSTMAKLGVIKGYPDGRFGPSDPITRAEFAAIAARFDGRAASSTANFSDILGHWAEMEISKAAENGWVNGYTDGTFRPDAQITRAEAMALINRVLNRNPASPDDLLDDMITWPDNMDQKKWCYLDVQEATNSHDFERKEDMTETWTKITPPRDWASYEK